MAKKILIVDDKKLLRESLIDYLSGDQYEFVEADNGKKAVEIYRDEDVDLVLLDENLPGIDGTKTLQLMKKIKQDIPNVKFGTIISGDSLIADVELKQQLYNEYDALCVDMDSAAVAITSSANKTNFYIIKVILDFCDENASEDYNNNFEKCCLAGAELFIDILRNSKL